MMIMNHFPSDPFGHAEVYQEVFCGCGEAFANHKAFTVHSLLDHQGLHVDGSSHFLSKFTLVVLPTRHQQTKLYLQDGCLLDLLDKDHSDVHTKRKAKERQEFSSQQDQENNEANQPNEHFEGVSLEKLALVRNESSTYHFTYYCGNCRQKNISSAVNFIIHLRDICPIAHEQSTHYLTQLDYDHQVQEYMKKTHEPKQLANRLPFRTFFKKIFGTNVDHSDLPCLCWPCRQVFPLFKGYSTHITRMHQGRIHQNSSHVILRFNKHLLFNLNDRLQWIRHQETALCPCNPSTKMTVKNLIRHVRQVHHGVSPLYTFDIIEAVNAQINNHIVKSINDKICNIENQLQVKMQQLQDNIEQAGNNQKQLIHAIPSHQTKKDINYLRLFETSNTSLSQASQPNQEQNEANQPTERFGEIDLDKIALILNECSDRHYRYYCGNCKQNNTTSAVEFILHLRDICPVVHKKSSHYLTQLDYDYQIQKYLKKTHKPKCLANSFLFRTFLKQILGTNIDHSDLPFLCWPCRQVFTYSVGYWIHIAKIHQGRIHQNSSHVVLKLCDSILINLTDRLQWIHSQDTALCPCDLSKKMTVKNLIRHLRLVHHGVSPLYTREIINLVINEHQNALLNNNFNYKGVQSKLIQTEDQQDEAEKEDQPQEDKEQEEVQQILHQNRSNLTSKEVTNFRLVRTPKNSSCTFQCGNCKKKNFNNAQQFIIHLKDICNVKHPRSSHFLIERNIQKEIKDYQQKQKHWSCKSRNQIHKAISRLIDIPIDHSDLSLECGVCRQIFDPHSYYLHILGKHSEIIGIHSSHIIIRFKWRHMCHLYISDRVPWINQQETYFCPCKPDKMMTMKELIKHVREVHMGISPIYEIVPTNKNIRNQNKSPHRSKIYQVDQANYSIAESQTEKSLQIERNRNNLQQTFDYGCSDIAQQESAIEHLRLAKCPGAYKAYAFYCGNCKRHDFRNSVQFIIHLKDICKEKHQKSTHFLSKKDIKKEIQDYQMKKDHLAGRIHQDHKKIVEFITNFLGTTYDHSDLTFECYPCRQIFKEGCSYYNHALFKHSQSLCSTSSHIILSFPSSVHNKKFIYISDRVPWVNNEKRYYCPCTPEKKVTMVNLIQHVKEVHKGISPQYKM